jgi:hypothetical protein
MEIGMLMDAVQIGWKYFLLFIFFNYIYILYNIDFIIDWSKFFNLYMIYLFSRYFKSDRIMFDSSSCRLFCVRLSFGVLLLVQRNVLVIVVNFNYYGVFILFVIIGKKNRSFFSWFCQDLCIICIFLITVLFLLI